MAKAAGLAGFSCEWPGRNSPETALIQSLVAANNAMPSRLRIRYLLCFDVTIWAMQYKHLITNWYDPIELNDTLAVDFASEIAFIRNEWPKMDPGFKANYLHIDGRPAVFVYNAHGLTGAWEKAIARTREECEPAGGVFLIGDFEVSPHPMFDKKRKEEYPRKAALFDAVSDYTLFSGHTTLSLFEYISSGQLKAALDIGQRLGESSRSGQYYPGIITQYFKSQAVPPASGPAPAHDQQLPDRTFVIDGKTGFVPIYKAAEGEKTDSVARNSQCTLQLLLRETFQRKPRVIFITSWNEPYEGTMIEPTVSANPAGYVMRNDFLTLLGRCLVEGAPLRGDFDSDGDVDSRDEAILKECMARVATKTPCCVLADLDGNGKVDAKDKAAFEILKGKSPQRKKR
jgi:hypothetical protein